MEEVMLNRRRTVVLAGAVVLLAASVFHFGLIRIPELKQHLRSCGLNVSPG